MFSVKNIKKLLFFSMTMIFVVVLFYPHMSDGQINPFSELQENLEDVVKEETQIMQDLFILLHEIEQMEKEQVRYAKEIQSVQQDITEIKSIIANEKKIYKDKKAALKYVLKSYQRRGPGSTLEIILQSENISTLLRRLNVLRDFSRNKQELLTSLDESRERLVAKQISLNEKLISVQNKQDQIDELLAVKIKIKEEKEAYMASLKKERAYYEEYQIALQQEWNEVKKLFPKITTEFSRILKEEDIPEDALKITFSFFSINGFLDDKTLNDIIAAYADLPEINFYFYQGKVKIEVPKNHLILTGTFVLEDEQILKFEVEKANFYGMLLEDRVVAELFEKGDLLLSFKPLLGKSHIEAIKILDGYLEVTIIPVLF